jgi:hypothetical protein
VDDPLKEGLKMFKLVALLFLITNGVAEKQPSTSVPNKRVFPSAEACMAFIDSDEGKSSKARLDAMLTSREMLFEAKLACVQVEDDSI